MHGGVTPVKLTTPLELGRILLVIENKSGYLGLTKTLKTYQIVNEWAVLEAMEKGETCRIRGKKRTWPVQDADNVRFLARQVECVGHAREGGAEVDGDDDAVIGDIGSDWRHSECDERVRRSLSREVRS